MLDLKKLLIVLVIISAVVASEFNVSESENNNGTDEARSEVEARRRHHHLFSHHSHLWVAGLHALAIYWAIKIKIFLVVIAVGFAIFYGIKVWAGTKLFSGPTYAEPYPIIQETPYHAPYEHIIEHTGHDHHSGPDIYSSYPGPEPYSAWSSSNGPTDYSAINTVADPQVITINTETFNRRNSNTKQKRDLREQTDNEPDWSDLVFTFLGVHSMDCRKRFVCEMEIKTKGTKISRMAFKFLSENFLGQYRDVNNQPQSIRHCMQMYKECEFVNDFDDGEQVDLDEAAEIASVDDNRVRRRIFGNSDRE